MFNCLPFQRYWTVFKTVWCFEFLTLSALRSTVTNKKQHTHTLSYTPSYKSDKTCLAEPTNSQSELLWWLPTAAFCYFCVGEEPRCEPADKTNRERKLESRESEKLRTPNRFENHSVELKRQAIEHRGGRDILFLQSRISWILSRC